SGFHLRRTQSPQDFVQGSVAIPLVEQIPDRRPGPKFLGQITPRGARSQNPQDPVHNAPPIARRPSSTSWLRKDIFNASPFVIRETVPYHLHALLGIMFSTVSPQLAFEKRAVFRQSLIQQLQALPAHNVSTN